MTDVGGSLGPDRDRDPAGRARNARPRDASGRPLPYGERGVARVPEDLQLAPAEALAEAERLLRADLPFQAHEVLEAAWKAAAPAEAGLWRGLAQLAVGLTHLQRGNARGAAALLRRGAENLQPYAGEPPHGVPAGALAEWAHAWAEAVERGDPPGATPGGRPDLAAPAGAQAPPDAS